MAEYEQVIELTDFYDSPRSGVALFHGKPHHFKSRMLDFNGSEDIEDVFDLTPFGETGPVLVAKGEFRRAADCQAGKGEWAKLEVRWTEASGNGA